MQKQTKAGFTLIELLVVVLIIGILVIVAVPQYQKAVVKSKNAEMKQIVKAVADAERTYYLANGKYAANFGELDIDLPLTPIKTTGNSTGECITSIQGIDSSRQAKDYYVALNSEDSAMGGVSVVAYWRSGNYKCAGFGIRPNAKNGTEKLHCREKKNNPYSIPPDSFCKKIEQGNQLDISNNAWRYYSLP